MTHFHWPANLHTCRYPESARLMGFNCKQNPAETIVCLFESAVFFVIHAKN